MYCAYEDAWQPAMPKRAFMHRWSKQLLIQCPQLAQLAQYHRPLHRGSCADMRGIPSAVHCIHYRRQLSHQSTILLQDFAAALTRDI